MVHRITGEFFSWVKEEVRPEIRKERAYSDSLALRAQNSEAERKQPKSSKKSK
jgi:prophage antirepressor-like protein